MSEPLLLSKDKEGKLHCLSNVCTHRGNLVVDRPCKLNDLRCKYHGRRFNLDGKFISMPEFKEVKNFPTEADDLINLPMYQWGKLLFASLGKKLPSELFFQDMAKRIGWMPVQNFVFHPELSKDYYIDAHWALYCENYLEGFHIPYVHHGLNEIVDYGSYTTEMFRYSSLQTGFDAAGEVAARYLFVFPNLMFNFYPWGISVNVVRPVSPSKSVVEFLTYVRDESLADKGAGADLHSVEMEDEAVVESVQKGIRSRFYSQGRYSPTREQGTHHFHRLIAEFMG